MRWIYLVLPLVIVTIIAVFIAQNRENETVVSLNQRITAPLSIYFVAVYFLGMWSGGTVVGFVKRAYQHATERQEQKRAQQRGETHATYCAGSG
jgi:uncharacterized integral membrane protein